MRGSGGRKGRVTYSKPTSRLAVWSEPARDSATWSRSITGGRTTWRRWKHDIARRASHRWSKTTGNTPPTRRTTTFHDGVAAFDAVVAGTAYYKFEARRRTRSPLVPNTSEPQNRPISSSRLYPPLCLSSRLAVGALGMAHKLEHLGWLRYSFKTAF